MQKAILCPNCYIKSNLMLSKSMVHTSVIDNGKNELMLHTDVFHVDERNLLCCTKKNYRTIHL